MNDKWGTNGQWFGHLDNILHFVFAFTTFHEEWLAKTNAGTQQAMVLR